jgi:tRNA1(Val) A37 N6-methylase TrmN6
MEFLNQNYTDPLSRTYDLILCNPPYFNPTEGQLSPSQFKNRCRFFIDATQAELLIALAKMLKPNGEAFVLSRQPEKVKDAPGIVSQVVDEIRGTPLMQHRRHK